MRQRSFYANEMREESPQTSGVVAYVPYAFHQDAESGEFLLLFNALMMRFEFGRNIDPGFSSVR